jgi:enamine deaminase RidA (YjgF/YER057c/UK114 family)
MIRAGLVFAFSLLVAGCTTTTTSYLNAAVVPVSLAETYATAKYAPAMRVGGSGGQTLYLSGVVATLADGETTADMTPAINRAFDEIELILSEANSGWHDVVDVTSYMTNLDAQIGPLWAVKEERLKHPPYPAWTAIGVSRLYGGEASIIEIKVTAHVPK